MQRTGAAASFLKANTVLNVHDIPWEKGQLRRLGIAFGATSVKVWRVPENVIDLTAECTQHILVRL